MLNFFELPHFSFRYGGKPFEELEKTKTVRTENDRQVTEYLLPDGLRVTHTVEKQGDAFSWVTWFEHTGEADSQMLTDIYDGDVRLPFPADRKPVERAFVANGTDTRIFAPNGSDWSDTEFCCETEQIGGDNQRKAAIFPGQHRRFATTGGRSSQKHLPFFDVNRLDSGVILAIGWTGQWFAEVSRDDTHIRFVSGVEGLAFYLHPGEKVRTSSVTLLEYHDGRRNAHNRWRSIVRTYFSLFDGVRAEHAPMSLNLWGGLDSEKTVARIRKAHDENLAFEYTWIDAGWYGDSTQPCPDEFEGDWGAHTGDWRINPTYHPDEMQDIVRANAECGVKFLLWFEPERVVDGTPITKMHPEYFLRCGKSGNLLLDLGNPQAWDYCHDLLHHYIQTLQISCLRQDFNFDPLEYWRQNDESGRAGLRELRHIEGLYRLWDTLLAEFPHLLIDNCASGGRRIDIETLRRSVPLWRSDYQCPANHDPDVAQNHTLALHEWVPFNGTSVGRVTGDVYHTRSCYTSALGNNVLFSGKESEAALPPETFDYIRRMNAEYKRVRPLMEKDFYPLTSTTTDKQSWCAMQFADSEKGEGMLLLFRRAQSPYAEAVFSLGGMETDKAYTFTDADTGETFTESGAALQSGFSVRIGTPRTSKLFFYSVR